ncbi:diguanylate cyclase domain-containing protein [Motiliproteus sp. MSK22-1]|uniref:sensor domain-containing diguanylate cyclase n=1 Tax=Motiliproteus sp. MSK22-1 TaxID=1897630 RepID=UPI0009762E06|nr:diguanylate cyclase [Motiliproteus sp. MSK22-1]OMH39257.1 hypothetical protein BGP75_03950 [Motiliproteus sp. MSK22-1]
MVNKIASGLIALDPQVSVALAHFITAVTAAASESQIYATLAQNLKSIIPNERASVTLLNPASNQLDVFALHGKEGVLPVGQSLPLQNSYTGQAVVQQKGQLHHIDSDDKTFDGILLFNEGIQSIINAPLIIHGKSVGAINAASTRSQSFNTQSLELLMLVARLVSTNLERQKLLREREQTASRYRFYATQLENMHHLAQELSEAVSIAETLKVCEATLQSIIPSQRMSYARYRPESDTFEITLLTGSDVLNCRYMDASNTGLKRALTEQQPLYYSDFSNSTFKDHQLLYEKGMISAWSIPIRLKGKIAGVLNAASAEKRTPDDHLVNILGTLGAIVGSTFERLKIQDELIQQVNHDTVTGLPNRRMLYQQINKRIYNGDLHKIAVLFVDLDHFKNVNDTLGHQVGDELLCLIGKRIRKIIRKSDLLARIGGDEFVVLTEDRDSASHSCETANRIIQCLSKPFNINGNTVTIGASIGISHAFQDLCKADDMIKKADIAMYDAKKAGRNTFRINNK